MTILWIFYITLNVHWWTGESTYVHNPIWIQVCKCLENVILSEHHNKRLCILVFLCSATKEVTDFLFYYSLQDERDYNKKQCPHYIKPGQFSCYHAAQFNYKENKPLPV